MLTDAEAVLKGQKLLLFLFTQAKEGTKKIASHDCFRCISTIWAEWVDRLQPFLLDGDEKQLALLVKQNEQNLPDMCWNELHWCNPIVLFNILYELFPQQDDTEDIQNFYLELLQTLGQDSDNWNEVQKHLRINIYFFYLLPKLRPEVQSTVISKLQKPISDSEYNLFLTNCKQYLIKCLPTRSANDLVFFQPAAPDSNLLNALRGIFNQLDNFLRRDAVSRAASPGFKKSCARLFRLSSAIDDPTDQSDQQRTDHDYLAAPT